MPNDSAPKPRHFVTDGREYMDNVRVVQGHR